MRCRNGDESRQEPRLCPRRPQAHQAHPTQQTRLQPQRGWGRDLSRPLSLASPVAMALQARHGTYAEDAGGADGDAGLHVGLGTQAQQAHLAHVAVAVAHPHLGHGLGAATLGRGRARELQKAPTDRGR